jgi:hypothetical protein
MTVEVGPSLNYLGGHVRQSSTTINSRVFEVKYDISNAVRVKLAQFGGELDAPF